MGLEISVRRDLLLVMSSAVNLRDTEGQVLDLLSLAPDSFFY
ncbi:MAG: hypothetical protein NZ992_04750 [Candidatus Korarchaeum sp.]|nr:hypothetical protein [Candidatus Korarchaeum sp.]MDW8036008.1 hypothetical protein [Candidatus Korarchaeum sp.]